MRLFLASVFLSASVFSSAQAHEWLPLEHGHYVEVGVPCADPSRASMRSYDGKELGAPFFGATIFSATKEGDVYTVKQRELDFTLETGNAAEDAKKAEIGTYRVKVLSKTQMKINRLDPQSPNDNTWTSFRFCSKM